MRVLVVIVTYNAMRWLDRCLASLRESVIPLDVMVIDNLSKDETVGHINMNYPEVILVQPKDNLGFGKGNNIGLQYAIDKSYDYVYLLNQDAWILPNTIAELIEVHKSHPEYGILSPMQIQANGVQLDENFRCAICNIVYDSTLINDISFNHLCRVYDVPFVMAAHWLISRECLRTVGGFSPSFRQYGEDGNYASRALYHNFKIGVCFYSKAVHDREFRKLTKLQKIYSDYVACLTELSGFNQSSKYHFLWVIIYSCYSALKYRSYKPILNLLKIFNQYKELRKNRIESLKPGAFLNIN